MSFELPAAASSDMRGAAREHHREIENRRKWSRGAVAAKGRDADHPKPAPKDFPQFNLSTKSDRLAHAKDRHSSKTHAARQIDMLSACNSAIMDNEEQLATDSSAAPSAEEDNAAEPTTPLPDNTVMYSFDNARGPSTGSQILSAVVDRALEKFEDRETTQLVQDEYELVDADGESIKPRSSKKSRSRAAKRSLKREDDEYEFV